MHATASSQWSAGAPISLRRVDQLPAHTLGKPPSPAARSALDLSFGDPDMSPPLVAADTLAIAACRPGNQHYAPDAGSEQARYAFAGWYLDRFAVDLDPDNEVVVTVGAKQALTQLLTITVAAGDTVVVPAPSYPSHRFAPVVAGAHVVQVPIGSTGSPGGLHGFLGRLERACEQTRPRVVVLSFPHNPTGATIDPAGWRRLVALARRLRFLIIHDFTYADITFDGFRAPSVLAVPGGHDVAVEIYSLTKSFSMSGWRMAFAVGNRAILAGLLRLKQQQDHGVFLPIQHAAAAVLGRARSYPDSVAAIYQERRDVTCQALARAGWQVTPPAGTMFVWAPIPAPYRVMGSAAFSDYLTARCGVATAPGDQFGPGGDGHVRFALVAAQNMLRTLAARLAPLDLHRRQQAAGLPAEPGTSPRTVLPARSTRPPTRRSLSVSATTKKETDE